MPSHNSPDKAAAQGRFALLTGGIAAVLASTCCLGPLVLMLLGFSGAWIANLTALESYQPVFLGVALVAMYLAWQQIWRPAAACQPGDVCALPHVRRSYQLAFGLVAMLVLSALVFPFVAHFFY